MWLPHEHNPTIIAGFLENGPIFTTFICIPPRSSTILRLILVANGAAGPSQTEGASVADRKKHRTMTAEDQARYSESRYGQGVVEARPLVESKSDKKGRRGRGGSSKRAAAHTTPTRAEGADEYSRRRKKRRRGRVLRFALVTILLVLVGAGTALGLWISDINSRLSDNTVVDDDLLETLVAVDSSEPFYMLLLGIDKSEERAEEAGTDDSSAFRADTIILARVDPTSLTVTLVSIPRDTLVDMGEYGENKINAAYTYGGAALMTQVVSELAGVEISHYAEVDFEQLTTIVDTIGGIEVTLPIAISDEYAEIELEAGTQTIDGATALGLCRARHAYDDYGGGDFYRAANQRMVIGAIVKKVLQLDDLSTLTSTVSTLADSVTTDLSVTDILSLVVQFRDLDVDNDMYSGQLPTVSEYINNIWYEVVDEDGWAEMMERVKAGESPYSDASQDFTAGIAGSIGTGSNISDDDDDDDDDDDGSSVSAVFSGSVYVLNGAGITGLGASTATTLESAGFTATAGNASSYDTTTTVIYYNDGSEDVAAGVAETLGIDSSNIVANDGTYSTDYDVVVLLGTDMSS